MLDRVIVVFPRFPNLAPIHQLRGRFDPLAELIPPHLTLVFPFMDDQSTEELHQHIRTVTADIAPFPLRQQGVTGSDGEYLFLNVKRGNDELVALHDRLYTGPLQRHLRRDLTFTPHLTVGRITSPQAFRAAVEEAAEMREAFETVVDELSVYAIHPDGKRKIELTVSLRP